MEILLEIEGRCIPLHVDSHDDLLDVIQTEARKYDSEAKLSLDGGGGAYLLQKWSRKWDCYTLIKLPGDIENGDRVQLVKLDVKECADKGIKACQSLKKPSLEHKKILNQLYPACSSSSRATSFHPLASTLAEKNQSKKKASIASNKSRTITAVLLDGTTNTGTGMSIPRGKSRKLLNERGRIRKLQISRKMTSSDIKEVISSSFGLFGGSNYKFMRCNPNNTLSVLENQDLNGNETAELAGSGSLYLNEVDESDQDDTVHQVDSDDDIKITAVVQQSILTDNSVLVHLKDESILQTDTSASFVEETGTSVIPLKNEEHQEHSFIEENLQANNQNHGQSEASAGFMGEARTNLITQQNEDFEQSLSRDRYEDNLKAEYESHQLKLQDLKCVLKQRLSSVHGEYKLAFRLPNASRYVHYFTDETHLKDLYGFVFSVIDVEPPFLLMVHPQMEVPINDCVLKDSFIKPGVIIYIAFEQGDFDPLKVYGVNTPTSTNNAWNEIESDFSDQLKSAEISRTQYMNSFHFKHGLHTVSRGNIYSSLLSIYKNTAILEEFPVWIKFEGEKAIDTGGVGRDMFSAFFEEMYRSHFEGSTLVTPLINPEIDINTLQLIGAIISHAYMVSGILPIRIAFPCLAAILLSKRFELPDNILVKTFIESVSLHDQAAINEAYDQMKSGFISFTSTVNSKINSMASFYGCRKLLKPDNLHNSLVQLAIHEFQTKPAAVINYLNSGIPPAHVPFWQNMPVSELYSVYQSMSVSSVKVVSMIEDHSQPSTPSEERVLGYLRQYVGNMNQTDLQQFLRFVTGASVCSNQGIIITFNHLDGLARRPIVHACGNTLELSVSYTTYSEFVKEFDNVLKNDDSYIMDSY